MPILGPEAVATITMIFGIVAIMVAVLVCALTRINWKDVEGLTKSFAAFTFSTAPLAFLLWNCVAINFNTWQDNTVALEAWGAIAGDTQHIYGVGTTLLAYATLSTIIAATVELVSLVRERMAGQTPRD